VWSWFQRNSAKSGGFLMNEDDPLIVTRHAGLIEWLGRVGIKGEVFTRVNKSVVRGRHVYGTLPIHLAVETESYTTITIPRHQKYALPEELTADEMMEANAYMQTYRVYRDD